MQDNTTRKESDSFQWSKMVPIALKALNEQLTETERTTLTEWALKELLPDAAYVEANKYRLGIARSHSVEHAFKSALSQIAAALIQETLEANPQITTHLQGLVDEAMRRIIKLDRDVMVTKLAEEIASSIMRTDD